MAWVKADGVELLSNTMETLLEFNPSTGVAASFPIKGTQPRYESDHHPPALDVIPKERAEHIMIVDLIRNDLGRVCLPGTVQVPSLLGIEGYKGVWHGVSLVSKVFSRPEHLSSTFSVRSFQVARSREHLSGGRWNYSPTWSLSHGGVLYWLHRCRLARRTSERVDSHTHACERQ